MSENRVLYQILIPRVCNKNLSPYMKCVVLLEMLGQLCYTLSVPFLNAIVDHWHGVRDLFISVLNGPGQSFGNFPVEFDAAITDITANVDHTYKGNRFSQQLKYRFHLLQTSQCRVTFSFHKNDFHKD